MDLLRRLANLIRKELLAILKDPANRIILLMPALVQTVIFGYAATYDLRDVPYALLDESRGAAASELVARLDGSGVFHRVATLDGSADIAPAIDRGAALMAVHIGPRFEQQLNAGEEAPVQLILDARNSQTAGTAGAYFGGIVAAFNAAWAEEHGARGPPATLRIRTWYNPNLESSWNMLPALIGLLSMLQTLLLTALSVAREREQGTFDQLLVTPYRPMEVMVGKAVPSIMIGLTQSTIVLTVALLWFRVPMAGSFPALYGALLLFTVASVGIGLAVSALSATMQQAMLYTFVLIMPLVLLSGIATPVRNMPQAMQWLTMINPLRFAVDMIQRIYLEGVGLGDLVHDIVPLLLIAFATLPVAAWLFRNRLV